MLKQKSTLNSHICKYDRYLNIYSLFATVFLYQLTFTFQGLDVTDFGFHLTNQMNTFEIPMKIKCVTPLTFLTDLIGGIWLSIVNHPSVLWARLGGVILTSLNSMIIYSILSTYFERNRVFIVVLISTLFITMHSESYIHYYTFPAFLINIDIWLLNKTINIPQNTTKHKIYSFMLGLMLIPIILSRIPLLLILTVPMVIAAYYPYTNSTNNMDKLSKTIIPFILTGFLFSSIAFLLFYWKFGILETSIASISNTIACSFAGDASQVGETHTMHLLLKSYLRDCKGVIIGTSFFITGIYVLSIFKDKTTKYIFNFLIIFTTFIGIIGLIISGLPIDSFARNIIKVAIGFIIFFCILYLYKNRNPDYRINILLITGLLIMIISPIGSNTGVCKAVHGMWLILPLTILSLYTIHDQIENKRLVSIGSLINIFLLSLLITSIFFQITNVYRDDINRMNLNTEFSDPTLKGVYSTYNRTKIVDETLMQIRKYSNKGDTVLMVGNIPMFYYLTETKPALGNPWVFTDPIEKIKQNQEILENEGDLPKLFIYSKIDTSNQNWHDAQTAITESSSEKLEYLKNIYINKMNYSLMCENEIFAIYEINTTD